MDEIKPKNYYIDKWLDTSKNKKRSSAILYLQRLNDAVALLLEGKQTHEITPFLIEKYGIVLGSAYNIISKAKKEIRKRKSWEIDSIVELHLERYEMIFSELYKINSNLTAMNALRAKEKLLQFHKNSTHMRVNNNNITQISMMDVGGDYDINKLQLEQRDRLQQLISKMRR